MSNNSQFADLRDAENAAISLASDSIPRLLAMPRTQNDDSIVDAVAKMAKMRHERQPALFATIHAVVNELRKTRTAPARFGNIVMATAHEAAIAYDHAIHHALWHAAMTWSLRNDMDLSHVSDRFDDCIRNDIDGVRQCFAEIEWPNVGEIIAEVHIESAKAADSRKAANAAPQVDARLTPLQRARNWLFARYVESRKRIPDDAVVYSCERPDAPVLAKDVLAEHERHIASIPVEAFHQFLESIGADSASIVAICKDEGWVRESEGGFGLHNMKRFYDILPAIQNPWQPVEPQANKAATPTAANVGVGESLTSPQIPRDTTATISRRDLPRIITAIDILYRILEAKPLELHHASQAAADVVRILTPSSLSPNYTPTEITDSTLDRKQKTALLDLREHLARQFDNPLYGDDDALHTLDFLDGILTDLRTDAQQTAPRAGGESGVETQDATRPSLDRARFRRGPDYRDCTWNGERYTFTPMQAACVQVLWEERDKGTLELSQQLLLEKSGAESQQLKDVFKSGGKKHPAWGTMIVRGSTQGSFRLSEPK